MLFRSRKAPRFSRHVLVIFMLVSQYSQAMDATIMDTSVSPRVDFYQYACGKWLNETVLTPETHRYNTYSEMDNNIDQQLVAALEDDTHIHYTTPVVQFLTTLYKSGIAAEVFKDTIPPSLVQELEKIQAVASKQDVVTMVAWQHSLGLEPLFRIHQPLSWELRNGYEFFLRQAGLGLGHPRSYMKESNETADMYRKHIAGMFQSVGLDSALSMTQAELVWDLEREIAQLWTPNPANIHQLYNRINTSELIKQSSLFDWNLWFEQLGIDQEFVILGQPDYFYSLNQLIEKIDLSTWKAYLTWHILLNTSKSFPSKLRTERNRFLSQSRFTDSGNLDPRITSVRTLKRIIPEVVDEFYRKIYYTNELEHKVLGMVQVIQETLLETIMQSHILPRREKRNAIAKISNMHFRLGGDMETFDYSSVELKPDDYFSNLISARRFSVNQQLAMLGHPVSETHWHSHSHSLDLYYDVNHNSLLAVASLFQTPLYSENQSITYNYAALGSRIAHEMIHAIDMQGFRYNMHGKKRKVASLLGPGKKVEQSYQALLSQFDQYEVLPGIFIDGQATLMENYTDLGGLTIAYAAWKSLYPDSDRATDREFFTAYAQVWKETISAEALTDQAMGPHSPARYRAIGPLLNHKAFHDAFKTQPDDPMYITPDDRIRLW